MSAMELLYQSAGTLAASIRDGELTARQLMEATLARIAECNPRVNAICTLIDADQALALADAADRQQQKGADLGPLHGLPMAIKDLSATRGIRTTMGSQIFKNNIPDADSLLVQRLKAAGALVIGKTNTPEFGTGSHTFNAVFGTTNNPYNLDKTVGGSSGGAAAALASGMLCLADGSDMGGSLRNPAAFCSVVGLPAIWVPCGFTAPGLPVGLQIVGPPRADLAVLQAAYALEQAMDFTAPDLAISQTTP